MAWNSIAEIRGPKGDPGEQGIQGEPGEQGEPGAPAPAWSAPFALPYAASLTPNCNNGLYQRVTATGNPTLNPPSNASDGMKMWIRVIASGGVRTVSFASSIQISSGLPETLEVPSGKRGDIGLLYDATDGSGAWTLLALSAQV